MPSYAAAHALAALGVGAASALALPIASEVRVSARQRPLTDRWQHVPVEPRRSTLLGISFRPPQAAALGLDARTTLERCSPIPFSSSAWAPTGIAWSLRRAFCPDELDWQIDAAERAGKQIILCVGALKTFGYPEFFVPAAPPAAALARRHARRAVRACGRCSPPRLPSSRASSSATGIGTAIVAWQVEHEAVDPLGVEHSWRLAASLRREEVAAVARGRPHPADPDERLLTHLVAGARCRSGGARATRATRWRSHSELADIVGIDFYPRHALVSIGGRTLYLDGSSEPLAAARGASELFAWARAHGRRLMISEGQAEPWEAVTTPPNPAAQGMYSCLPEQVIENYNQCLGWGEREASACTRTSSGEPSTGCCASGPAMTLPPGVRANPRGGVTQRGCPEHPGLRPA